MTNTYTLKEEYSDVIATQWFEHGAHAVVGKLTTFTMNMLCKKCGKTPLGMLRGKTPKSIVCPSDWILEYPDGKLSVMSDKEFKKKYKRKEDVN